MLKLENRKAVVGDLIKSFDFEDESGCRSNYYQGVVTGLKTKDGVDYVHFTAVAHVTVDRYSGDEISRENCFTKTRAPQNGTTNQFGRKVNSILCFVEEN